MATYNCIYDYLNNDIIQFNYINIKTQLKFNVLKTSFLCSTLSKSFGAEMTKVKEQLITLKWARR